MVVPACLELVDCRYFLAIIDLAMSKGSERVDSFRGRHGFRRGNKAISLQNRGLLRIVWAAPGRHGTADSFQLPSFGNWE
jgi:hypothetical protein